MVNRRVDYLLFSAALGIFFLGTLVYLFDRSAADIYFIPEWWRFADGTPGLFGTLGGSLPSFAHTYCFILLFSALLAPWSIAPWVVCVGWCATEALLELAQADFVLVAIGPDWLDVKNAQGFKRLEEKADHVLIEIETALLSDATIIPVLIGNIDMPVPDVLPEAIRELAFRGNSGDSIPFHV